MLEFCCIRKEFCLTYTYRSVLLSHSAKKAKRPRAEGKPWLQRAGAWLLHSTVRQQQWQGDGKGGLG